LGNDPERQLEGGYKRTQISRVFWFLSHAFFLNTQTEIESESLKMEKAGGVVAAAPTNTVVSAMDAFEKLEKVGEGTYGKVYRARERATGKIVALKKTRLHEDDEGVPPTTLREVSILRMLSRDPHVVRYSLSLCFS
jgi:serine/threonine protein kinase